MRNKSLQLALIGSIMIHVIFVAGIATWSLRSAVGLGGGEGLVEVGVIGAEGGGSPDVSLRGASAAKRSPGIDRVIPKPQSDFVDGQGGGGGGSGSGDGGSKFGLGSGTGEGDPRLTQIWKKINRAKYYPEVARREGVEGAPKVAFSITEEGRVAGLRLVQSSGNDILDNAALEAIQNSAPLPFYPQPITIAVRYSLKDR